MEKVKEICKRVGSQLLDLLKGALMPMFFYGMLSSICFMGTMNEEWTGDVAEGLNGSRIAWVVIIALIAAAYHGVLAYAMGGKGYEMLVSGNLKRRSAQAMGTSMKISSHKEEKEFRYWRGFVTPWIISLLVVVTGLVFGANQTQIDTLLVSTTTEQALPTGLAILFLALLILGGWSIFPFLYFNLGGMSISYYWSIPLAILPIVFSGVFYIVGAYAARGKAVKKQQQADLASQQALEKPKKINYGGLPGTKPKKKK